MSNNQQNAALEVAKKKQASLKTMLIQALPSFGKIASKAVSPEKLVRIALVAASRRPDLLDCTPQSILSALLQAAQMGLEPETPLQHSYLIPYRNNKTGQMEAQFQESYRGLLLVATRNGIVSTAHARLVYKNEKYEIEEGLHRELKHTPIYDEEDRGEFVLVYAVTKLKDGEHDFEVMTRKQIEGIRMRSRAANAGPWKTDYEQMVKKTVLRRLLKRMPIENEQVAQALQDEDGDINADVINLSDVSDSVETGTANAQAARGDALASEIEAKRKAKEKKAQPALEQGQTQDAIPGITTPLSAKEKEAASAQRPSQPQPQKGQAQPQQMAWGEPPSDDEKNQIEREERGEPGSHDDE